MKMNSGECCIDLVENIVATSFGMITPAKMVNDSIIISHMNGDSLDNSIENLVMMKDEEIFRDVGLIGFANNLWFVSNHGNVYGNRYKKILKTQSAFSKDNRYKSICLRRKDDRIVSVSIHRLVAMLFVYGNTKKYNSVNHIDGNTNNNHYLNLEWVDIKMNTLHAKKLGLMKTKYGEETSGAKITEDTARRICELLLATQGDIDFIANELDVPWTTVRAIKNGFSWTTVSCDYFEKDHFRKKKFTTVLDEKTVRLICKRLVLYNFDVDRVYDSFDDELVDRGKIYRIKTKAAWKTISDEYF
jgi:hypothetical protein